MGASNDPANPQSRLARLLSYVERDPGNLQLIADAADAALEEGEPETTAQLLERHAAISPLPPPLRNLQGLAALNCGRFEDASQVFAALHAENPDDPAIRVNLAWCKAMACDHEAASALLDDASVESVPRAAALKVQTLHHLGRLEEALAWGRRCAELHPDDEDLMSALALVAMDAEDAELARHYAARAGDSHEGLATLGMLALNEGEIEGSLELFDRALHAYPASARALLGRGLGLLTKGDPAAAAAHIDRSAEIFGDHVGSWVASGWAHFINGDYRSARASFERALAADDTFAECHGGLAVVDIAEGEVERARGRVEVALRLDRNCFSGALAKSLIVAGEGDQKTAERIRSLAMNSVVGTSGRTLAQAMAGLTAAVRK